MTHITDFPPGIIGVLCNPAARYTDFCASITGVEVPPNTKVTWSQGVDLPGSCNALAQNMLDNDLEWLWIMGDDHMFEPDLLHRLLDHDLDIVVPLCPRRNHPFDPVIYSDVIENKGWKSIQLSELPSDAGLIEVRGAGSAGMLIKRTVFEQMDEPWFRTGTQLHGVDVSEDLYFCEHAIDAGFKIHCDLDAKLGHIRPITVVAARDKEGQWGRSFEFGQNISIFVHEEPDAG